MARWMMGTLWEDPDLEEKRACALMLLLARASEVGVDQEEDNWPRGTMLCELRPA